MQRNQRAPRVVSKHECRKVWQVCLFIPAADVKGRTYTLHALPSSLSSSASSDLTTAFLPSFPTSFLPSKSLRTDIQLYPPTVSFRLDETLKVPSPLPPGRPFRRARYLPRGTSSYLSNNPREGSRRMIGYLVFEKYRSRVLDVRYFRQILGYWCT